MTAHYLDPRRAERRHHVSRGQRTENPTWMVDLSIAGAGVIWGANNVLIKHALASIHPLAFNSLRLTLASSILLLVLWVVERDITIERRLLWRTIWVGVCGHAVYQILFITGLDLTVAGRTAVILAGAPAVVACIGQFTGTERYALPAWCGIAASLTGIVMLTAAGKAIGGQMTTGDLLVSGATVSWAVYTVSARPLLTRYSPLKVTALTMAFGAVPLFLYSIPSILSQDWSTVSSASWGVMAFSAIFALVINYVVWSWGIKVIGSGRTAIYYSLNPVTAGVLGCLALGESWVPSQVVGSFLVLSGVNLVRVTASAPARSKSPYPR